jgi:hypothetical protein
MDEQNKDTQPNNKYNNNNRRYAFMSLSVVAISHSHQRETWSRKKPQK